MSCCFFIPIVVVTVTVVDQRLLLDVGV